MNQSAGAEFQDLIQYFGEIVLDNVKRTFEKCDFNMAPEGHILTRGGDIQIIIFDPEFCNSNQGKDLMMQTLIEQGKKVDALLMAIASDSYIMRIPKEDREKYAEWESKPASTWPEEIKSEALTVCIFGVGIKPAITYTPYNRELDAEGNTTKVTWEESLPVTSGGGEGAVASGRFAPEL